MRLVCLHNMTGLSGNVTLGDDKQWVSDFGTILAGASPSQLTQLTDGSFYHGFMTIDMVTASTNKLPTDPAYPFSPYNCLTGQIYYVRLLEGAANGIPMVHIEGGVSASLGGLFTANGFYQFDGDREEIDADGRHYAYTSSRGLPSAVDPNGTIRGYILGPFPLLLRPWGNPGLFVTDIAPLTLSVTVHIQHFKQTDAKSDLLPVTDAQRTCYKLCIIPQE